MSIDSTIKAAQYPATSRAKHASAEYRRASAHVSEARQGTKVDPLRDNLSAKRDAASFPALAELRSVAFVGSTAYKIASHFCIHNKLYPIKIYSGKRARMSRLGYVIDYTYAGSAVCRKCSPR